MEKDIIILLCTFGVGALLILFVILIYFRQKSSNRQTQRHISDKDLLLMLDGEPDQLLSPHQLADKTELTLNEARARLSALYTYGVLQRSYNSRGRHFYSPRDAVIAPPVLNLSNDPFLTVEDLLQIFDAYDYKVTAQQMILATGLPLAILKRELKYFEDQKIIQKLQRSDSNGMVMQRFYVLQDPYRSDPDRFRAQAGKLDLEMREILLNDNLIV
ncbi:DUF1049 domain-containing protein [Neolewinella aurantiaca]|uniref:DUF1049 domain-containing protein n=1 Tax=Neolewinella aurantiaca TaxID=2602767 RepID=A0A5C7FLX9_9BACT|nr:LapA family protein [Neolewinella aurantiaca]TXF91049.1 DUF1049 domain-containing protein [Neolewinella aurantiaca]